MTAENLSGSGKLPRLFPLVIVGAGTCAYLNSFSGTFVFDDLRAIVDNPNIHTLWPPWVPLWYSSQNAVSGRPMVSLSLAVNYAISGLNTWSYHLWNLAVHLAAGMVLYGLARRSLLCPRLRQTWGRSAPWLALAISLIWVVHPLQTESVTYISTRTESMMGLFYLWTLYCLIRGEGSIHRGAWSAAAVLCCAMGMASKEAMATAPLMALLFDRAFLSDSFSTALRRRWPLYAGLAATWVLLAGLVAGGPRSGSVGFQFAEMSAADYARTQFSIILRYIRLAFWPHPLVVDYYDWPLAKTFLAAAPHAVVVIILLAASVWAWLRNPPLGFLGAWFFLILAPSSSILPLVTEIAAERRMYLPLAALIVLAVLAARSLLFEARNLDALGFRVRGGLGIVLTASAVATLGYLTFQRNTVYQNELALWHDAVAKRPNNARAHNNLGVALVAAGRLEEGAGHYQNAVTLHPGYAEAFNNLGATLCRLGRPQQAVPAHFRALELLPEDPVTHFNYAVTLVALDRLEEAVERYRLVLALRHDHARAHTNLGAVLSSLGRIDEALAHFSEAVRAEPNNWEARTNIGNVLVRLGLPAQAVEQYVAALHINPDDATVRTNLGTVLVGLGRYAEAAVHLEHAARLRPDDPQALYKLGFTLEALGRAAEAVAKYREALRLQATFPLAAMNLARILAVHEDDRLRDPAEAVRWAEAACQFGPPNEPTALDVLAAAYASAGRFADAVQAATQAVQFARAAKRDEYADQIQSRLDGYRENRPAGGAVTPRPP